MDGPKLPPPPPNPSTLSSFEEELRSLRQAVSELTQRVDGLERHAAQPVLTIAPQQPQLESRFGLTLVNRAGAITLAIGIIFFFKYAVDNKWIGATGRVWIGVVAGLLLLCAAAWLQRRGESRVFTQGLAGCGLATIYAAVYAALAYYELIIPIAGWLLLVLVSALAVWLSIRYSSAAIAALGFSGALLTPVLLQNKATPWWFDFLYLVLLGATELALALRQRWAMLVPWIGGATLLGGAIVFQPAHPIWFVAFAGLLAATHFAAAYRSDDARLTNLAYITAHSCLLVAAMRLVALGSLGQSTAAAADRYSLTSALESVLLAFYGIVLLIYGMVRNASADRTFGLVLLGIVIGKLYLWDIWQLNTLYRVSAFVLLGVLLLAASFLYSRFRAKTSD